MRLSKQLYRLNGTLIHTMYSDSFRDSDDLATSICNPGYPWAVPGPKPSRFRKLVYAENRAINYRERHHRDRFSRCIMRRTRSRKALYANEKKTRLSPRPRQDRNRLLKDKPQSFPLFSFLSTIDLLFRNVLRFSFSYKSNLR